MIYSSRYGAAVGVPFIWCVTDCVRCVGVFLCVSNADVLAEEKSRQVESLTVSHTYMFSLVSSLTFY